MHLTPLHDSSLARRLDTTILQVSQKVSFNARDVLLRTRRVRFFIHCEADDILIIDLPAQADSLYKIHLGFCVRHELNATDFEKLVRFLAQMTKLQDLHIEVVECSPMCRAYGSYLTLKGRRNMFSPIKDSELGFYAHAVSPLEALAVPVITIKWDMRESVGMERLALMVDQLETRIMDNWKAKFEDQAQEGKGCEERTGEELERARGRKRTFEEFQTDGDCVTRADSMSVFGTPDR